MEIEIVDLADRDAWVERVAELLAGGFAHAWTDAGEARAEVARSLGPGRLSRVAVDGADEVIGWIAGIPGYGGRVYELHPLVVRQDRRGSGVGRALVADFERQVRARGGLTVTLGADDEDGETSLSGVDPYADLPRHLSEFHQVTGRHPSGFYLRLGYVLTGIVPDANGPGKPDLLLSKRVTDSPAPLHGPG